MHSRGTRRPIRLTTERLRIRPFTRGDVEAVFAYRAREDVARYLFDEPMSHESVTEAVQTRIGQTSLATDGDKHRCWRSSGRMIWR